MEPEDNTKNKAPEMAEMAAEEVVVTEAKPVADETPKDMPKGDIVFNDKPKKKTGMILGMILLFLIAAGGVGFGVWAWMNGNSQKDSLNAQINSLKEQNSKLLEQIGEEDEDVVVDVEVDAWENFSSNLAKEYKGSVFGSYYSYNGSDNVEKTMTAYVNENNHLTISDTDTRQTVAEADNVISVYYVRIGNGSVPYFYIISKDGSVSRYMLDDNDGKIETVSGYKNIVSVIGGGDLNAWLIDINGNLYRTN